MHTEAVNDSVILHSTLLKLGRGDNSLTVANQPVATQIKGQVWFVRSTTFFVPARGVSFTNNTLTCTNQNLTVHWQYSHLVRKGPECFVTLD